MQQTKNENVIPPLSGRSRENSARSCKSPRPGAAPIVVLDEFELGEKIGSGTFGEVYKCRSLKDGRMYALKRFKHKFVSQKKAFEQREVQILQRFN